MNVEELPGRAEGFLGDNYYDFFYEIDKVVVGPAKQNANTVSVERTAGAPSPKRARTDITPSATDENSEEQGLGSQTESVRQRNNYMTEKEVMDNEEDSMYDSAEGNELFLDKLARENEMRKSEEVVPMNKWLIPCPILQEHVAPSQVSIPVHQRNVNDRDTMGDNIIQGDWPSLIVISDVTEEEQSPMMGSPGYTVLSPVSPTGEGSVEQMAPEAANVGPRVSARNQQHAAVNMVEKATVYTRKRNLEGLQKPKGKELLQLGATKMRETAAALMRNQQGGAAVVIIYGVVSSGA